jgi:hypothetical protein
MIIPLPMPIPMNRNVANRDIYLIHIEKEIEIRRKKLLEKQQKLNPIVIQNQFLEKVKQDYANYHAVILQQKQEQLRALELLNQYIHDLQESGKLSKHNIKDSIYEQKKILGEIKKIKKNVDELIQFNQDTLLSPK